MKSSEVHVVKSLICGGFNAVLPVELKARGSNIGFQPCRSLAEICLNSLKLWILWIVGGEKSLHFLEFYHFTFFVCREMLFVNCWSVSHAAFNKVVNLGPSLLVSD